MPAAHNVKPAPAGEDHARTSNIQHFAGSSNARRQTIQRTDHKTETLREPQAGTSSPPTKSIRHGHPSTLHLWWARWPLAACRAVLFAQLVDDPSAWPEEFPSEEAQEAERQVSPMTPVVAGGALIVPAGLLTRVSSPRR